MALDLEGRISARYLRRYTDVKESVGATNERAGHSETGEEFGSATNLVFCCRNMMAEYVYIGAGMNVSLPPVFRKWIGSVEVVS
jgi:hypothetical protein